jgi:N-acetylglucosaminyldiphosphoundecaprenol N-acetyl-beta-D-mannosaminyltransferase
LKKVKIINSYINVISMNDTIYKIKEWAIARQSKYVCVCNTHSLVTETKDDLFSSAIHSSTINVADGMPVVWALRIFGHKTSERVDGPNLMINILKEFEKSNLSVYLYGGTEERLKLLESKINYNYPNLKIIGSYSPPFRDLSKIELDEISTAIELKKPNIILVSLGCPKQEKWMLNMHQRINCPMVGIGAAFDYYLGKIKRPPIIFQTMGLEWLFRLINDPTRLFKRYAYNNTLFIFLFIKTYFKNRNHNKSGDYYEI